MKKNILALTMVLGLVLGLFGIASVSNAAVATVSAGVAQSITLPTSTATLSSSATATSGSTIAGYNWVFTSGPVVPVIVSATLSSTLVTGLTTVGNYVFTLTASDNSAPVLTGSATATVTVNPVTRPVSPVKVLKSKLEINPNGKVNLHGELMSIAGGVLTVKVWGITFTVNTANAKFDGKVKNITEYKVGDMVSIKGTIDSSALTPTINARSVKDMTAQATKALKENNGKEKNRNN